MTNLGIENRKLQVVIGTRGSALARWQTNFVAAALKRLEPGFQIETRIIKTTGDKDQTRSLADLGGLGVFTKEIESALLACEIDLAVHSLKDLPTELGDGLAIAAITEREDSRDALVSRHRVGLMQLPRGARVGTSSARRSAQVRSLRPDVQIVPLRGNVDTRLRKAQTEEYDAIVIAAAGVIRLGRADELTEYFPLDTLLPDPGQGALAIEIRASDVRLAGLVSRLDHAPTRSAVTAERAFLRALGGGCRMPIGAHAAMSGDRLHLDALIASEDGSHISRGSIEGEPARADELGRKLAARLNDVGAKHSPLRGKKILVTRARSQASAFAEKISTLGGEPIESPAIDFAPLTDFADLDDALEHMPDFNWVVFTSANGVSAIADRLRVLGKEPRSLKPKKVAAIGPATANALKQLGLCVDFVPTKFLGEQIAVELPIEPEQRILLLRADIASDALQRGLEARRVAVTNIVAYRTIMPPVDMVDLTGIDAVTFTSSSTVRNFVAMQADLLPALPGGDRGRIAPSRTEDKEGGGRPAVFCIGPVTAETARELGLRVDAVADEHTIDGLVNAMLKFYGSSG